jgi:hypothetical protein
MSIALVKFFSLLVLFSLFFSSSPLFAKKPTLSSLNYAINLIQRQNSGLKKELKSHQARLKEQHLRFQEVLQKQLEDNKQTQQTLQQVQQQLTTLKAQQSDKKSKSVFYLFFILSAFALGLSALSLFILRRKHHPETQQLSARLEQIETDIVKLTGQTAQQYHEVDALKVTQEKRFKDVTKTLNTLDNHQKQSYERRQAVEKELKHLLQLPITHEATEADRLVLNTMLEEGNLNFEETLQAKSLVAEYQHQWQRAVIYWDTLLAENKHNTVALLHLAYGYYKLAELNRNNNDYLDKSMDNYNKIMTLAPEYFEDINGYDDDENMGASELVTDPDKVIIYQQIEKLVVQVDELKNYYAIYNLACQYAKEGNSQFAQDWLEQISLGTHTLHCKHLQKEEDLDSIRPFPWFQSLIKEACENNKESDNPL